MIKTYSEFLKLLTEGLITTYPLHMLDKQLRRWLDCKYDIIENVTNDIQLYIHEKIDKQVIEILHYECVRCGYFISVIIVLVTLYLIRIARLFIIFINKGISLFYLILYLCALEFLPVVICLKYISGLF